MKWQIISFTIILTIFGIVRAAEDDRPIVDASKVREEKAADTALPTFHIVGDSTVKSGGTRGMFGWGERIKPFFDTNKINIVNHAIGGRSARTFFTEGRWQRVADAIKTGDLVIIQFGTNDQGDIGEATKHRGDLHGVGEETAEDTRADGTKEIVHTFGWYMTKMVNDAKARGATVIICSPIPHKQKWENGRDFENLAGWDKQVAEKNGALFFDLTMVVSDAYRKIGAEKVETLFADKGTHTTDEGAQFNAACVVAGLKSLPGDPFGKYFSEKGETIERYTTVGEAISTASATAPSAAKTITQTEWKFSFAEKVKSGWTRVTPTDFYSSQTGFGFEPGAKVVAETKSISSDAPFYFSVNVPEGNYKVTATLGGEKDSTMTVKAELRRLMLERVQIGAGKSLEKIFIVNVRTPKIGTTNHVHLKPRETTNEWWAWDNKLTIEFNGTNPSLRSLEIEPVPPRGMPTVFLLGDSTVCDQPSEPWNSWGQMLTRFFKSRVTIANNAESGETIANSLRAQRFEKVFSLMKKGDYLFIQFSHNDMKSHATNALEIYKADLKKVVERTRSLGGTPVLVTSMEREAGVEAPTLAGYPDAVREIAKEEKCALIDLNAMSLAFYKALGANLAKAFQDPTHHNNYGSYELAKCVALGIQQSKLPLKKFLVDDFKFDPSHPDDVNTFEMAVSPNISKEKPLGN